MTRINDLDTATLGLNPSSSHLWAVFDGKDYKLRLDQIGDIVGRGGTLCVLKNANAATLTNTEFQWSAVLSGDTNYWNASSANLGFVIPNDLVSYVSVEGQFGTAGGSAVYENIVLRKNETIVLTGGFAGAKLTFGISTYGEQRHFKSGPIPVNSGDRLNMFSLVSIANEASTRNMDHMTLIAEAFA